MARKKAPQIVDEFSEDEEQLYISAIEEVEVTEASTKDDIVSARVKGTWTLFFGRTTWNFVDGQRYKLPRELFTYLKKHGNIYDTMA